MGLPFRRALLSGARPFTPLSLFSAGEVGAWYDPSDFSTMFQDAAGTTPVTAVEQPVGLILDKSKSLAIGSELVTNGGFDSATGWTVQNAFSIGSGVASVTSNAASSDLDTNISVTADKTYIVTFTVSGYVSGSVTPRLSGGTVVIGTTVSANGTYTQYMRAATGNNVLKFRAAASSALSIDNVSLKEIAGNHASQTTSTSRPVLKQDENGKYYLLFDGTDDFLVTGTINPGSVDKAQVFAGVRKLSDAARGVVAEFSAGITTNAGAFVMDAPQGAVANLNFASRGTSAAVLATSGNVYAAPITNVMTGIGDISGDVTRLRVNGVQAAETLTDQGTGNYGSYPLYIGRRGGISLPFNGRLFGLIVRFSAENLPDATITNAETWMNTKTGAY